MKCRSKPIVSKTKIIFILYINLMLYINTVTEFSAFASCPLPCG